MKKLDQKVAIVTGAAQGIGLAIAEELALAGAHVAIFDLKLESAQASAAEIAKLGVTSRGYAVDISFHNALAVLLISPPFVVFPLIRGELHTAQQKLQSS